jgi:hypothetical protein
MSSARHHTPGPFSTNYMKTTLTIILITFMTTTSYSQDLNGIYLSKTSDSLIIYNDSLVRFNFDYGCCLLSNYYGFGKLIKSNDYQIVKTEDSDLYMGSFIRDKSRLSDIDIIELIVIDNNGNPIEGANIVTTDKKDRFINGMISSRDYVKIDKTDNLYKLTIFIIGL